MFSVVKLLKISTIKNWESWKSYPKAATAEAIGMAINDMFFFAVWYIIIQRFGKIGGWGINEALLYLGVTTTAYGIIYLLFAGSVEFKNIIEGKMDSYMIKPHSSFWQLVTDKISFESVGDTITGLILLWFAPYNTYTKVIGVVLAGAFLFGVHIMLMTTTIYLNIISEGAIKRFYFTTLTFTVWPVNTLSNSLKFATMLIIPAYFLGTGTIEAVLGVLDIKYVACSLVGYYLFLYGYWRLAIKKYQGLAGQGWISE